MNEYTRLAARHIRDFREKYSLEKIRQMTGVNSSTIHRAIREQRMGSKTLKLLAPHIPYIEDHLDILISEAYDRRSKAEKDASRAGPPPARHDFGFPRAYKDFVSGALS
jgi:hypothetical protein